MENGFRKPLGLLKQAKEWQKQDGTSKRNVPA
jgi:hypothetical protein